MLRMIEQLRNILPPQPTVSPIELADFWSNLGSFSGLQRSEYETKVWASFVEFIWESYTKDPQMTLQKLRTTITPSTLAEICKTLYERHLSIQYLNDEAQEKERSKILKFVNKLTTNEQDDFATEIGKFERFPPDFRRRISYERRKYIVNQLIRGPYRNTARINNFLAIGKYQSVILEKIRMIYPEDRYPSIQLYGIKHVRKEKTLFKKSEWGVIAIDINPKHIDFLIEKYLDGEDGNLLIISVEDTPENRKVLEKAAKKIDKKKYAITGREVDNQFSVSIQPIQILTPQGENQ